jgi:pimeloyl-ACP methyl ester carboxylesterase
MRLPLLACLLSLLMGCATTRQNRDNYRTASAPTAPPSAVVFVADGAGDSRDVSQKLSQVVAQTSAPLQIETFVWSRGYNRIVADQVDHDNHLIQGRKLAEQVIAYRQAHPDRRIYLVGQSAGSALVLSAAELLPPDSIDRIVLLSASVCTTYDLRPALRAARDGIDGYHSRKDRLVLGLGMRIVGTTEGGCHTAAGRVGFRPIVNNFTDAVLYSKLRQHPWDRTVRWSGHNGGHFGNHEPEFLRAFVLPLLDAGPRANAVSAASLRFPPR